jgi:hypothetical protein
MKYVAMGWAGFIETVDSVNSDQVVREMTLYLNKIYQRYINEQ